MFPFATPYQVFVLKYYTMWGFVGINMPLRDRQRRTDGAPHKLAVTVFTLTGAIKKLRAWAGRDAADSDAQIPMDLFRGIKSRQICEGFMAKGGTEFAPMSSTGELWVALKYSQGGEVSPAL